MTYFERALAFTLRWEGGYVDDPDDSGGATNQGVTQASYDRFRSRHGLDPEAVLRISDIEVRSLYYEDYWLCSQAALMDWPLCLAHFDGAVNCGLTAAARMLQRAVDVAVDGVIGSITLGAAHGQAPDAAAMAICRERERYYDSIILRRPTQRKFLSGWMNRLKALTEVVEGKGD